MSPCQNLSLLLKKILSALLNKPINQEKVPSLSIKLLYCLPKSIVSKGVFSIMVKLNFSEIILPKFMRHQNKLWPNKSPLQKYRY